MRTKKIKIYSLSQSKTKYITGKQYLYPLVLVPNSVMILQFRHDEMSL